MKQKNKIIVLIAPSCAGKDTIGKIISDKYGYNFVISTTTRPMRDGESENNPYHFVTDEDFIDKIKNNEMIEYRAYNTLVDNIPALWYYGTEKKEITNDKKYITIVDMIGLKALKQEFGNIVVSFFLDVDEQERKNRCVRRGDFNEFEWNRRAIDDKKVFAKEYVDEYVDYTIQELDTDKIINIIINKTQP